MENRITILNWFLLYSNANQLRVCVFVYVCVCVHVCTHTRTHTHTHTHTFLRSLPTQLHPWDDPSRSSQSPKWGFLCYLATSHYLLYVWYCLYRISLVSQMVKNLPIVQEAQVWCLPASERSPGEGNGNPLQCSFLENPMDRGSLSFVKPGCFLHTSLWESCTLSSGHGACWHFLTYVNAKLFSIIYLMNTKVSPFAEVIS